MVKAWVTSANPPGVEKETTDTAANTRSVTNNNGSSIRKAGPPKYDLYATQKLIDEMAQKDALTGSIDIQVR